MLFLSSLLLTVLPISTLALPTSFRLTRRTNDTQTATPNNPDPQNSLTLDPSVLATGFENDGQRIAEPGQVASLTSSNNFINFCATLPQLPITNGKQITTGSCNPAPMGAIPSTSNMPSAKFVSPTNMGTVQANTNFTISVAISGMQTGFFVNAQQNYFSAPQQLNPQGQIIGHSHIVIEALSSITQTTPSDPTKFAFFKGLNAAAEGGILTTTASLPAGVYKMSTINTAANHQPVLVPIAQHGSLDDAIYFTVTADGNPDSTAPSGTASTPASTPADTAPPAVSPPATGSTSPAAGGPAFDPAGAKNIGNGQGTQFIGGQCLSSADCASGCCAGPSGICSGVGAQLQNGKTGCGFSSTAPANGASPATPADTGASATAADAATPSAADGRGHHGKKGGKKGGGQQRRSRLDSLKY